ncbi:hypothetical protein RRG08_049929 [Elysia crispata]|uniref:Uncharacterized protein n=1 Tax=Elysia crispata TaxID=231223 RepID=A0AAE0XZT6_9GAST|nr:hypothetical protein RRG08_049929 [Elysia crispata]
MYRYPLRLHETRSVVAVLAPHLTTTPPPAVTATAAAVAAATTRQTVCGPRDVLTPTSGDRQYESSQAFRLKKARFQFKVFDLTAFNLDSRFRSNLTRDAIMRPLVSVLLAGQLCHRLARLLHNPRSACPRPSEVWIEFVKLAVFQLTGQIVWSPAGPGAPKLFRRLPLEHTFKDNGRRSEQAAFDIRDNRRGKNLSTPVTCVAGNLLANTARTN